MRWKRLTNSPTASHVERVAEAEVRVPRRVDRPHVQDVLPRARPAPPPVEEGHVHRLNSVRPRHDLKKNGGTGGRDENSEQG